MTEPELYNLHSQHNGCVDRTELKALVKTFLKEVTKLQGKVEKLQDRVKKLERRKK